MELLCIVPCLNQAITDRISSCLIGAHVVEVKSGSRQGILNMIDDGTLDRSLIAADVRTHELPHLLLTFDWRAKFGPIKVSLLVFIALCLFLVQVEAGATALAEISPLRHAFNDIIIVIVVTFVLQSLHVRFVFLVLAEKVWRDFHLFSTAQIRRQCIGLCISYSVLLVQRCCRLDIVIGR